MRQETDIYTADIFDPRFMARSTDPETSKEAAARVREFAAGHRQTILNVLRAHPHGLTAHEIAEHCQLGAHEIGKRLGEMDRAEMIQPVLKADGTGTMTRLTPGGRHARVWTTGKKR